jgi:hypothetical protein
MQRFEVFQGPGHRIIAISLEPTEGAYTVKQGTQGTTLRVTTAPVSQYASRDVLKAALLSSEYVALFTGLVDSKGYHSAIDDGNALGWSARDLDLDTLRLDLVAIGSELSSCGVPVSVTNDASGCLLKGPSWRFGITTVATPNCVFARTKGGHGTVFPRNATELLVVLCALAARYPFAFCEASSGQEVSRTDALDRGSATMTPGLVQFVSKRGIATLTLSLRASRRPQIRF